MQHVIGPDMQHKLIKDSVGEVVLNECTNMGMQTYRALFELSNLTT